MKDLGPPFLKVKNINVVRTDIEIVGARNHKIYCSHYEPLESERKWNTMPCVIYCHGNSSSRLEAKELVSYLLPEHITLFCFDFPGCGKSEGEYISLGHYRWFSKKCKKSQHCCTLGEVDGSCHFSTACKLRPKHCGSCSWFSIFWFKATCDRAG
jgi:hypothetical protein